ncbi:MAG: glycosyltransferase [Candidatus Anstonellales archaeon]
MRIAFFTDTYLPQRDGVVTAMLNLRNELEREGNEVFIFTPGTKKQREENKDFRVHYFSSTVFKPYPDYRIALFPFISATKMVQEMHIDVIHSHGIATTGLAAIQCSQKLKIPAIASFHTMVHKATYYLSQNQNLKNILEDVAVKYLRWYYKQFRVVTTPSNYAKNALKQIGIENCTVIPNGIDYRRFVRARGRKMKIDGKKGPFALYVGRIVREKNVDLIIDSIPSVVNRKKATFVLVGKGPYEEDVKNKIRMLGVEENVAMPGFVEDEELPAYYNSAKAFLFPSSFDTQGLSVLESMVLGCAPVVPANSAPAEFVKEGETGFLFRDEKEFPEKVIQALECKKKIGQNAKKVAREYDIRKVVKKYEELYQSILRK